MFTVSAAVPDCCVFLELAIVVETLELHRTFGCLRHSGPMRLSQVKRLRFSMPGVSARDLDGAEAAR